MNSISTPIDVNDFFHLKADHVIPDACQADKSSDSARLFAVPFSGSNGKFLKSTVIILLAIIYACCIVYIFVKKNAYSSTKARSPYTTMICFFLLLLDSVSNTFIFSSNFEVYHDDHEYQRKRRFVCWAGVWVTMMIFIPILYTMYIRVYRVRKVFELYEEYLRE